MYLILIKLLLAQMTSKFTDVDYWVTDLYFWFNGVLRIKYDWFRHQDFGFRSLTGLISSPYSCGVSVMLGCCLPTLQLHKTAHSCRKIREKHYFCDFRFRWKNRHAKGNMCVPLLLGVLRLTFKPAQKCRIRGQTVTITRRLQELNLSDHFKLLQREILFNIPTDLNAYSNE